MREVGVTSPVFRSEAIRGNPMNRDEAMVVPELAVFLGAGASCSEGAPSQSTLFSDFFSESFEGYHGCSAEHPSLEGIKTLKNRLVRFFNVFFGFDPTKPPTASRFPTFEEALGLVDLALSRDEGFREFEGNQSHQQGGTTLHNVRTDFVFLIALILDKKLEHSKENHRLLVQNLRDAGLLSKCAFVSFNYDILIDNALEKECEEHGDFLDYGIGFENIDIQPEKPSSRIHLLKLHGSLNWLYCSACRSITLTRYEKGVVEILMNPIESCCQKCGSLRVPIVIPPTYFKVLSNIFIQLVWYRAEQLLKSCRVWVFCGYSFPDADMHVKYLLKKVQVNSEPPKVVIINWHQGKEPQVAEEEERRYRRFLGAASNVEYHQTSFEQFAGNPSDVVRELLS